MKNENGACSWRLASEISGVGWWSAGHADAVIVALPNALGGVKTLYAPQLSPDLDLVLSNWTGMIR
jgi:hypothetical protein